MKRLPSVENAEGADALLRGSDSAATPAAGEGSAGPASGSGHGSPAAVPVGTPLLPEAVAEEALLPAEIEPALLPAELPPSLPPAEIEPAQLPAELPPALPPMPAEAAVELPVVQLAGIQYAPGDTSGGTSGGTGGGTSAALLSGAMLRSPPRGLEEEEPSVAEGGGGSPLSVPTAGAAPASRSLPMDVAAASAGGSAPVAPGLQGAILESLVEGLPSAVPPPQPLPLRPPSPPAASGFQAAVAALGSGVPTFAAAGGKLAAPFQLRGDGGSGAAGNPFGPATPSIDRGAPPAPAEPADQASPPGTLAPLGRLPVACEVHCSGLLSNASLPFTLPPVAISRAALPPPPPASRAGTAFTRELAAAAADLVDGTAPG